MYLHSIKIYNVLGYFPNNYFLFVVVQIYFLAQQLIFGLPHFSCLPVGETVCNSVCNNFVSYHFSPANPLKKSISAALKIGIIFP